MDAPLLKLLPIFAGFGLAYGAKRLGWLRPEHGHQLLKAALYVTVPAIILVSVARLDFGWQLLIFPLLPALVVGPTFLLTRLIAKRLRLQRVTKGTFLIAPLTINSGFTQPFVLAMFGGEALTRVVLFNAGYNPILLVGVYGIAAAYHPASRDRKDVFKRILMLPPLWALVAGLLVHASGTQIPGAGLGLLQAIGSLTIPLMIIALGALFEPRRIGFNKTLAIVGLRMGVGLVIGLTVATLVQLKGIDRAVLLALAAAPVGFNLLTFAAVEKLDEELAAGVVSLSLLLGMIVTPLILLFAK